MGNPDDHDHKKSYRDDGGHDRSVQGSGGAPAGGGGGSPTDRINFTESLGFTPTETLRRLDPDDDDDEPAVTPPTPSPSPSRPPTNPAVEHQVLHELLVIGGTNTSSSGSEFLQFVRVNDWHVYFPIASGQPYAYQFGGRSVEPGAHLRVRPEDACPSPPDSAPLIGTVTIVNRSKGTMIQVRACLSCGYIGIVASFKQLIDIGVSGAQQTHTDPGSITFTKLLELKMAHSPQAPAPILARLHLFDFQLYEKLRTIKYPFPIASPFDMVLLPGQVQTELIQSR